MEASLHPSPAPRAPQPLAGHVAFIHGGSPGIGAAAARRLAGDGAVAAVGYAASGPAAEALLWPIEASGGKAIALHADAFDAAGCTGAIDEVARWFGRLDTLCTSVGVPTIAPLEPFTLDDFDRTVSVKVATGPFTRLHLATRQGSVRQNVLKLLRWHTAVPPRPRGCAVAGGRRGRPGRRTLGADGRGISCRPTR